MAHPPTAFMSASTPLPDFKPDLVLSGINNGANMGDDTLYSGTVAAATEAYLMGIPAIAFSLADSSGRYWEPRKKPLGYCFPTFSNALFPNPSYGTSISRPSHLRISKA